jgi:hypothetical protein
LLQQLDAQLVQLPQHAALRLKRFDGSYRERGLTIIGVQTPEFDSEKQVVTIRRQGRRRGGKTQLSSAPRRAG